MKKHNKDVTFFLLTNMWILPTGFLVLMEKGLLAITWLIGFFIFMVVFEDDLDLK